MFSTVAEYELFKEFIDFSIGSFKDGWPHYNGIDAMDDKIALNYFDKVSSLFEKFSLEIETNLIFICESKAKTKKYLEKTINKLESIRELLHDNHYEVMTDEYYSWRHKIWDKSEFYVEKLITYCRFENEALIEPIILPKSQKVNNKPTIIEWTKDTIYLSKLYSVLKEYQFIESIKILDFESHFIKNNNVGKIIPINWQKEKYLLIYLFDELNLKGFLGKKYGTNCDYLISKHFIYKSKLITPRQLASSRHSFKMGLDSLQLSEKNKTFAFLRKCLLQIFESSRK
jgi:hypothetical protein